MATAIPTGLPSERYPTKRDAWLVIVMWGSALIDLAVAGFLLLQVSGPILWIVPVLVVAGLFSLHVMYATEYVFEGDSLRVRASVFGWVVPLAEIDSVEPTNNPLSSPACSLDRLLIRYGKKRIMISPDDKTGFLHTLATRAPQLELVGEGARRRA
ncbi:MAG: PH domain-containing protein [Myxococcota bacterium]